MANVGFIGLGNIGKGICGNLIRHGHDLTVYDVNRMAMEPFADKAYLAGDVKEVCRRSTYLFLSLPNSAIVEQTVQACLEEGITGKTIIDTSTSYPVSTKRLYERVKAAGGDMVDAPLMAGPQEAEAGILEIMVGGDQKTVESLSFLFDTYCRKVSYAGPIGSGHLAKLAMNFCGLTEALLFAQIFPVMAKYGFEQEKLYDILHSEALDNWMFRFYADKYVKQDYRLDFALELGLKDLTYMKQLFDEVQVPGFLLDGALDLCRMTLDQQQPGETLDFSYPCHTIYEMVGLAKGSSHMEGEG